MSYYENLVDAFKILIFNQEALNKVANNEKGVGYGFLTLVLVGVIGGLLTGLFIPVVGLFAIVIYPIVLVIGFIIGYGIYHFLAKLFGGKATGAQYFRALSNMAAVEVISFIPILGTVLSPLIGIWLVVANGFVLHKLHQLSLAKAIIVLLIPLVVVFLLVLFIGLAAFATLGFMFANM